MQIRLPTLAGAILAVIASLAIAAPSGVHLAVPGGGDVVLLVPDGWAQSLEPPTSARPPSLMLSARSGPTFSVAVTTFPARRASAATLDPTPIRALVAAAAQAAQSQSVEKSLAIQELPGSAGHGFYFLATDRAPNPGEWKYLTQGAVGIGGAMLAFTILTNDGQAAVGAAAFDMLQHARFEPPGSTT